eukprot:1184735-Prorocentrum_minimum.AAC.1
MREKWKQSDGGVITIRAGLGKVRTSEGRLHTSSLSTQIHTGHAPQSGPRPPCRSRGRTPVLTQTQLHLKTSKLIKSLTWGGNDENFRVYHLRHKVQSTRAFLADELRGF